MTVYKWSTTAASNDSADSSINWLENQAPSTLNNSARAMMAAVAKLYADMSGKTATGGSLTAYTVTSNQVLATLTDGFFVRTRMHVANGAAPTLSVDGLSAKPIQLCSGVAVSIGKLVKGAIYGFTYSSGVDAWLVTGVSAYNVGDIIDSGSDTAPPLCLLAYGQAVSRTDYPALFSVYGTTYGSGDGSTTFNLPDLRGRVSAGQDDMGGSSANRLTNAVTGGLDGDVLGGTGGSETNTLTSNEIPSHTHASGTLATASAGDHSHTVSAIGSSGGLSLPSGPSVNLVSITTSTNGAHTHTMTGSTAATGSGAAHNNLQPTIILNKYVYAGA